MTHYFPKLTPL